MYLNAQVCNTVLKCLHITVLKAYVHTCTCLLARLVGFLLFGFMHLMAAQIKLVTTYSLQLTEIYYPRMILTFFFFG